MRVTFLGATQTVTGSKTLVEAGDKKILVDCGLFQGYKALRLRNWAPLPFSAKRLDAILLTHAHIDHSGCLPLLVRNGFRGSIYCTEATAQLCKILLMDTAHLQEEEASYLNRHGLNRHQPASLPLYTVQDAQETLKHLKVVADHGRLDLGQDIKVNFTYAGHILGAASVSVQEGGNTLLFSGDLGRADDLIMRPPAQGHDADWVVIESTYGDRVHPRTDPIEQLGDVVRRTAARGGCVIIPAFAVGRTQAILYALYRLQRAQAIPHVPVVLDSPMGIDATHLYQQYASEHRLSDEECQGIAQMTRLTRTVDESKALLHQRFPMVVIAGSGMVTGGRVLHHLFAHAPHARNSIVLCGFQAGGTRGASLAAGAKSIKLFGQYVPVNAEVVQIDTLSAHADQTGLLEWLQALGRAPLGVFVNHGEPGAADTLRLRIEERLHWPVIVPNYQDSFLLDAHAHEPRAGQGGVSATVGR